MQEKKNEPTHSFVLEDVEKYGSIEKALLVKEIRSLQAYKQRNGGSGWVYYSSSAFAEKFPYMKADSIKRWLRELLVDRVLESAIQNNAKFDQTRSYRLVDEIPNGQNDQSMGQKHTIVGQNDPLDGSKTHHHTGQNDPTIPSHTHSSLRPDGPALDEPATDLDEHRGKPSPNKEKIREAIRQKRLKSLKG